jgi:hypothetical protein
MIGETNLCNVQSVFKVLFYLFLFMEYFIKFEGVLTYQVLKENIYLTL